MKIIDALKERNIRVSSGSKWLYFDEITQNFVVLTRHYRARTNVILYNDIDEEQAVRILIGEEEVK